MSATPPTTREDAATEPSSWRPLTAMILTAIGVYAVLAVVLILEATAGGVHGLVWLVVPGVLLLAAAVSLFASLTPVRRRLAAFRTWSLEAEPSERSAHRPVVSLREHL